MVRGEEIIRIWHPDGREHRLKVLFTSGFDEAEIWATYVGGCANSEGGDVARWTASYVPPNQFDPGHLWLGGGRIDIEIKSLRGIGIGSLLMRQLVSWAKERPGDVPVVPISLAGPDAGEENRCRRNRFYEKFGFVFNYADDEKTHGEARALRVSELVTPAFKMPGEWQVESLTSAGRVF